MIIALAIFSGLTVAALGCLAYHILILAPGIQGRMDAERETEIRHTQDWKDLALKMTDRQLHERGLPILREEIPGPAEEPEDIREKTLAELEQEMSEITNPLSVSMEGELGRRRALARQIHIRQSESMLAPKSELATEDYIGDLNADDIAHLQSSLESRSN